MVQLYSLWDNPPIKYSDYLKKKGSVYTMDVKAAAMAADILGVEAVVPMHYLTFPILTQSVEGMGKLTKADVLAIQPGTTIEF